MDPDSIKDSANLSFQSPSVAVQESSRCPFSEPYPPVRVTFNVCIVLTSVLSIATFAQVRKFNATFVILSAMAGQMAVSTTGEIIANNVSYSLATRVFLQLIAIFYGIDSWLMVLLVVFRFCATRSTSSSGEGWRSGRRALIGISIVWGIFFAVSLPIITMVIKPYHPLTYYDSILKTLLTAFLPGLIMLCFGGALLLNYCRPPGQIMDREKGRSYGTVAHTGDGDLRRGPADVEDSELERELTRTVLVIALLNGITYTPGGVVFYLGYNFRRFQCSLFLPLAVFGSIAMVLPCINFFLYLLMLSDFRAVYRRCCRRRM